MLSLPTIIYSFSDKSVWLLDTLIRLAARLEENKSSAWSERQQIDLHQVAAAAVSGATRSHKSSFRHVLESQRMNHLLRWLRHRLGKNRAPAPAGWGDLICSSRCVTRICVHKRLRKKCQNYGSEGSLVFRLKLHFLEVLYSPKCFRIYYFNWSQNITLS